MDSWGGGGYKKKKRKTMIRSLEFLLPVLVQFSDMFRPYWMPTPFLVLGTEPRALLIQGEHSAMELTMFSHIPDFLFQSTEFCKCFCCSQSSVVFIRCSLFFLHTTYAEISLSCAL